jgi:hypothetical protein
VIYPVFSLESEVITAQIWTEKAVLGSNTLNKDSVFVLNCLAESGDVLLLNGK